MKSISIAEARDRLTEWLREAENGQPVRITRRGQPVAVLLSDAEYQRLSQVAAGTDFAAWAQRWRDRLPPSFDGIGNDDIERWQELA